MADRKLVIEAEFRASGLQSGLANATKQVQDFTRSLNTPANIAFNVDAKNLGKVREQIAALGQDNAVNIVFFRIDATDYEFIDNFIIEAIINSQDCLSKLQEHILILNDR